VVARSETFKISAASPPSFRWGVAQGGRLADGHDDGRKSRSDRVAARDRRATRLRGTTATPAAVFNAVRPRSDGSVRVNSAIRARGRIFVAGNAAVYAFTMQ